jgi:hypothetical protein
MIRVKSVWPFRYHVSAYPYRQADKGRTKNHFSYWQRLKTCKSDKISKSIFPCTYVKGNHVSMVMLLAFNDFLQTHKSLHRLPFLKNRSKLFTSMQIYCPLRCKPVQSGRCLQIIRCHILDEIIFVPSAMRSTFLTFTSFVTLSSFFCFTGIYYNICMQRNSRELEHPAYLENTQSSSN